MAVAGKPKTEELKKQRKTCGSTVERTPPPRVHSTHLAVGAFTPNRAGGSVNLLGDHPVGDPQGVAG